MTRALTRLRGDSRGVTIVEFAIVLPIMLATIMGLMDLCYQAYVQSVLTGVVHKAGRDSAIETNISNTSTIDAKVLTTVQAVASQAVFATAPTRSNFSSFQQIGRTGPEPFVDSNNNGQYDKGECFDDVNGNSIWDNQASKDTGSTGAGGASDVVSYKVSVLVPRLFPLAKMLGFSDPVQLNATTLLRNQPFASQDNPETTICS